MGARSEYTPGTFCWTDMTTPDVGSAKAFYRRLFGWEYDDGAGPGGVYHTARVGGDGVAGLMEPDDDAPPVPPAWLSYISVEDIDATAERAGELGGTVQMGPFDLGEVGRMAIVADPSGGHFAIWQPGLHKGAERVNEPGCMSLNQLNTNDPDDAQRFYGELFGWTFERQPTPEPYWTILNDGRLNGGLRVLDASAGDVPPHWLVFFTASDLDSAVEAVGESGGNIVVPQTEIDTGRIAVGLDPANAAFALYEGEVDP